MNRVYALLFFIIMNWHHTANADDVSGFILDQSISRSGHEFYYRLSALWQDIPNTSGHSVVIKETLLPQSGTLLVIELNNKVIYQTFMGRRLKPITAQVEHVAIMLVKLMASNNFSEFSQDMAASGL